MIKVGKRPNDIHVYWSGSGSDRSEHQPPGQRAEDDQSAARGVAGRPGAGYPLPAQYDWS